MNENIKPIFLGNIYNSKFIHRGMGGDVYAVEGISPTLTVMSGGGGRMPHVLIGENSNVLPDKNKQ